MRVPHVVHHLRDEHVVMAGAYGVATPLAHGPVGTGLVTVGYLVAAVLVASQHPRVEDVQREPCTGRHAVCRYTA
jgi:hypothetical protein